MIIRSFLLDSLKSLGRKIPVLDWFIPSPSRRRSVSDHSTPKMHSLEMWDPNEVLLRTSWLVTNIAFCSVPWFSFAHLFISWVIFYRQHLLSSSLDNLSTTSLTSADFNWFISSPNNSFRMGFATFNHGCWKFPTIGYGTLVQRKRER